MAKTSGGTRLSLDELQSIAGCLYGTDADLWTVTMVPELRKEDVRRQLRHWCNLVQDPITRVWFCPISRRDAPRPERSSLCPNAGEI